MAPPDRLDAVRAYYDARGDSERLRLENPYEGAVEEEIHRRVFDELIPAGARVLDVGGGPGHWTIWLLGRGHSVVLGDISAGMLEIGRREIVAAGLEAEAVLELDARDLRRFADGAFDVVLSLGPFYHLTDAADRLDALREAHRVLVPGGLLLATTMTRYPWVMAALMEGGPERIAAARTALDSGEYRHPGRGRFTDAFLFRVEDVAPFFESAGFQTRRLVASQGVLQLVQEQTADLRERDPAAYDVLIDMAYAACTDPAILGISNHLLYAGVK